MAGRLPIYLLLDCSESMAGEPLQDVEFGVYTMISALSKNPYAIETAFISVMTFAAKAKVALPLTELNLVRPPRLSLRPGTSLGAAMDLLRESIDREVVKTTADRRGDFNPLVFILTEGYPTDDWRGPLARLRAVRPRPAAIAAIGYGDEVDFETLSQIADPCVHVKNVSGESLKKLFIWLSSTVQSQSVSPEGPLSLDKVPLGEGRELIDRERPPKFHGRDTRLHFHVTCRKTKKPWLLRYKRANEGGIYLPDDSAELPPDFFSDGTMKGPSVSSELLHCSLPCPFCGNETWCRCVFCGHLFCFDREAMATGGDFVCPGCEASMTFGAGKSVPCLIDGSQG